MCNELRKTARSVTDEYDRALASVGLRLNQYAVLSNLSRLGTASLTEVAQALQLDQTSATRSIALLEKQGLVKRASHPDPRVKLLALTESGKRRFKAAKPLWEEIQCTMQERISEREWAVVIKAIAKLRTVGDVAGSKRKRS